MWCHYLTPLHCHNSVKHIWALLRAGARIHRHAFTQAGKSSCMTTRTPLHVTTAQWKWMAQSRGLQPRPAQSPSSHRAYSAMVKRQSTHPCLTLGRAQYRNAVQATKACCVASACPASVKVRQASHAHLAQAHPRAWLCCWPVLQPCFW